jgi:hypothetical protein
MKFEITQGCTAYNFTVDGKRYAEMTAEEKEKVIDHVLAAAKKQILDNHLGFEGIIEHFQYDSYNVGPKCGTCGDSVSVTIINI